MKDKNLLEEFFKRYAKCKVTEQEHEAFLHWLETLPQSDQVRVSKLYYKTFQQQQLSTTLSRVNLLSRIENNIDLLEERQPQSSSRIHEYTRLQVWSIAATIMLVFSAGLYFLTSPNQLNIEPLKQAAAVRSPNDNGGITAHTIFRLTSGEELDLDELPMNKTIVKSGLQIVKVAGGEVVFKAVSGTTDLIAVQRNNVITTPKGKQCVITLPDGSKVWLNSATAFNFPSNFSSSQRSVTLSGEGYFEVAKDKRRPFIVTTSQQTIEVLGTHFNVNAYADEEISQTTLLEGSVRIIPSAAKGSLLLRPGQLAAVGRGAKILQADTEAAVAWKSGYFSFSGENIRSIMRKLSRWYDVDIQYAGNITEEGFIGAIAQSEDLQEVLKMLELTGSVHFKVEGNSPQAGGKGRRVTVMP
jgi:ferric-dicitrate binding protein FerR (iron transport regulator)